MCVLETQVDIWRPTANILAKYVKCTEMSVEAYFFLSIVYSRSVLEKLKYTVIGIDQMDYSSYLKQNSMRPLDMMT